MIRVLIHIQILTMFAHGIDCPRCASIVKKILRLIFKYLNYCFHWENYGISNFLKKVLFDLKLVLTVQANIDWRLCAIVVMLSPWCRLPAPCSHRNHLHGCSKRSNHIQTRGSSQSVLLFLFPPCILAPSSLSLSVSLSDGESATVTGPFYQEKFLGSQKHKNLI